jgi:hypothetical protein
VLTSATNDGNGNFTTSITLPSSLTLGQHTIGATGVSSGRSASVVFDVTSGTPQGPTSFTDDNTRPGNGFGDRNHCHTGPPGHSSDRHGRGNHGNGGDNNDDQGGDD